MCHPTESAPGTGWRFASHGIEVRRLMSDNAWTYTRNRALAELLADRGIRHLLIPYRRPQVNGKV